MNRIPYVLFEFYFIYTGFHYIFQRKQATCQRCGRIQYPGPKNSPENHKKSVCSDGAPQKSKIPYPQPTGVFTQGKEFHATIFLRKVRELYGMVLANSSSGNQNLPMEYWAFTELFLTHMKQQDDGDFLFNLTCLGDVKLASGTPDLLLLTIDGIQYLRVSSLRDDSSN